MKYSFTCYGHKNITAKHKTTLEFTKDNSLTLKGDCIVGIKADFSLKKIKKFIRDAINNRKKQFIENKKIPIKIIIKMDGFKEEIKGFLNHNFNDDKEIVIRKSDFISEKTFAVNSDKAAFELNGDFVRAIGENRKIRVFINLDKTI